MLRKQGNNQMKPKTPPPALLAIIATIQTQHKVSLFK
jgi:hypothetical protein